MCGKMDENVSHLVSECRNYHNTIDLILLEKEICYILHVTCPFDPQIEKKEKDKAKNYTD